MSDTKLGELLSPDAKRDAIHIAVAPVVASQRILPGDLVRLCSGSNTEVEGDDECPIGIADPFLKAPIKKGQRFWLFLFQNTVTSLRHQWTHPAFSADGAEAEKPPFDTGDQADSKRWLTNLADGMDISHSALMEAADTWIEHEDYTVQHNSETWQNNFGDPQEFWKHWEIVTGRKAKDPTATFFSCSC